MSSDEDAPRSDVKRLRIQRACDACRRRKTRCDGPMMPGKRCTTCTSLDLECAYNQESSRKVTPKGYVQALEHRVRLLERLVAEVCPQIDLRKRIGPPLCAETFRAKKWNDSDASPSVPAAMPVSESSPSAHAASPQSEEGLLISSEEDNTLSTLSNRLRELNVRFDASGWITGPRFFGKSSGVMLIQKAMGMKQQAEGGGAMTQADFVNKGYSLSVSRPDIWQPRLWEKRTLSNIQETEHPPYSFPEHDLLHTLVKVYFEFSNIHFPLLHMPTFEAAINARHHLGNRDFGTVVMMVCAVASRWSDDDRVLIPDDYDTASAGWRFFNQVRLDRKNILTAPSLHDLQAFALAVIFLQGSTTSHACWIIVGMAVRYAQDVGAHRRKCYRIPPTLEEEQWKRAFWVLLSFDRLFSCVTGRPSALCAEDFDTDLPTECDDEYWMPHDGSPPFQQPKGKPSMITAFRCHLALDQVLASAGRTIFAVNKPKSMLGLAGLWEKRVLTELDSALNRWIDEIPDHLRWDPDRADPVFFAQSANIYAHYYLVQIIVHRQFISTGRDSQLSYSSLAICSNAARSCAHVVSKAQQRLDRSLPYFVGACFTSGIMLSFNIWGSERWGLAIDQERELAEIKSCIKVMQRCEHRWLHAGRLAHMLIDLTLTGSACARRPRKATSGTKRPRSPTYNETAEPSPMPDEVGSEFTGSAGSSTLASTPYSRQETVLPNMPSSDASSMSAFQTPNFDTSSVEFNEALFGAGSPSFGQLFNEAHAAAAYSTAPSVPNQGVPPQLWPGAETTLSGLPLPWQGQTGYATDPNLVDSLRDETMAMWGGAPNMVDADDWGSYIVGLGSQWPLQG